MLKSLCNESFVISVNIAKFLRTAFYRTPAMVASEPLQTSNMGNFVKKLTTKSH